MKSLKKNYLLNLVKTTLGIVFPLISYPYVSRILEADGLGKVSFSQSFANYFILFAAFGISNFAIREGAKFRDNKKKLGKFATEMFILNSFTAAIAYVLLVITLHLPSLEEYQSFILIFSLTISFNVIGMEWIFQLFEEYQYITMRAVVFQILSLIGLFTFVKEKEDVYMYCWIIVFASVGSQLLNFLKLNKFVTIFGYKNYEFKVFLKPIFVIFLTTLAMNLYQYIDVTLLGFLTNSSSVGLYAMSTKLIKILMTMISSITVILTPRLAYYHKNNHLEKFSELTVFSARFILLISLPATLGVFLLSDNIIILLGGEAFMEASLTIKLICLEIIFASLNGLIAMPILTVINREKTVLKIFFSGLVINILSNLILIHYIGYNGAAISTVITELFILVCCLYSAKDILNIRQIFKGLSTYSTGCIGVYLVWLIGNNTINNYLLELIVTGVTGAIVYFAILLFLKNEVMINIISDKYKKDDL